MKQRFRTGGLASWAIRRPIATLMLTLAVIVLGLFALSRLNIDLLPHIIYPEVRVRINEPGVPVQIVEDTITRQLEEQLAITEDAIAIQSTTSEGRSLVDLTFPYGKDIDIALRDASTRLDRAKRFLPDTIDPPIIFKRDPSQIPVLELAISSQQRNNIALRDYVDYELSRWFINLPGVAAAEVGGGQVREIHIIIDQERLSSFGFSLRDLAERLRAENIDASGGRITLNNRELSTRAIGRLQDVDSIANLPLWKRNERGIENVVRLRDVARIVDTHADERLRVRLNGIPGIKLSIQKQPAANTVAVVDAINERLEWLRVQRLLPDDINIARVDDQSTFIRQSLSNASNAAISGAILAMLVVYLFLGDMRRTLIIGTAIPLSIVVTFILMALNGLTLNIMTLGGIALGVGMVVDSTIVMLENITRHQQTEPDTTAAALQASSEVTSAIVASTTTNLAAILPFLFVSGLIGLLFSELIFTLTAAMVAALVVSITVVPALAAHLIPADRTDSLLATRIRTRTNKLLEWLQTRHLEVLKKVENHTTWMYGILLLCTIIAIHQLSTGKSEPLPKVDQGRINMTITAEAGIDFVDMDNIVRDVELLIRQQPEVNTVFTTSGGTVFGRSETLSSDTASLNIQLKSGYRSDPWIKKMRNETGKLQLVGKKVKLTMQSVRGIRTSRGDDDLSLRISGTDLPALKRLGDELADKIRDIPGLTNLTHTYEKVREELTISVDRDRAASMGITMQDVSDSLKVALEGMVVSEFLANDRQFDIRLRLPRGSLQSPNDLGQVVIGIHNTKPVRLSDLATLRIAPSPSSIKRESQRRIVEVAATLDESTDLKSIMAQINSRLVDFRNNLPAGYSLYDGGSLSLLHEGEQLGAILLLLALFLVYVVMSVQYESMRNPLIILLTVPLTAIGVWLGLLVTNTLISMPVWLGMIMLAGIVVNNAILLVEQTEIERERGAALKDATYTAARLRLRPVLMTTLTTVVGSLPLSLGIGEGAEMLQPLAVVIVFGLLFSTATTLLVVPSLYCLFHRNTRK